MSCLKLPRDRGTDEGSILASFAALVLEEPKAKPLPAEPKLRALAGQNVRIPSEIEFRCLVGFSDVAPLASVLVFWSCYLALNRTTLETLR